MWADGVLQRLLRWEKVVLSLSCSVLLGKNCCHFCIISRCSHGFVVVLKREIKNPYLKKIHIEVFTDEKI